MKRRYRTTPPPVDAEHIVGEMIVFTPEDDVLNAGKPLPPMVELTPVGPPVTIFEFKPEDDLVNAGKPPAPTVVLTPIVSTQIAFECVPKNGKMHSPSGTETAEQSQVGE